MPLALSQIRKSRAPQKTQSSPGMARARAAEVQEAMDRQVPKKVRSLHLRGMRRAVDSPVLLNERGTIPAHGANDNFVLRGLPPDPMLDNRFALGKMAKVYNPNAATEERLRSGLDMFLSATPTAGIPSNGKASSARRIEEPTYRKPTNYPRTLQSVGGSPTRLPKGQNPLYDKALTGLVRLSKRLWRGDSQKATRQLFREFFYMLLKDLFSEQDILMMPTVTAIYDQLSGNPMIALPPLGQVSPSLRLAFRDALRDNFATPVVASAVVGLANHDKYSYETIAPTVAANWTIWLLFFYVVLTVCAGACNTFGFSNTK